jgi:hypothetical protein
MSRARRPFPGIAARAASLVMVAALLLGCAASGAGTTATAGPASGTGGPVSQPPVVDTAAAPTATPAPTTGPSRTRPLNVPPLGGAASSRAYAEFLARVTEDRATVDGLDRDLTNASNAADLDAVRKAAVAILDFVEVERDWLLGHPPADCYADAHAAAMAMIGDYGDAADRFVDWSTTGGGLNGLPALGRAADAAKTAQAALATFASVLGGTSCAA